MPKHTYHLTRVSRNAKTGPIPVTTTSSSTCPADCPLKGGGCYAESGPLALHWRAVGSGARGGTLEELCASIRKFPRHQLWRWAQAGDLPGDGRRIDAKAIRKLVEANAGRRGFGYTHYDPHINGKVIRSMNDGGFTMNLSANSLEHADELMALGVGPVVTVLPADATKPLRTPAGNYVSVCPAALHDHVDCATCGVCAVPHRKAIIGFPAHGSGAKKAQTIFFQRRLNDVTDPVTQKADGARRKTMDLAECA